MKNVALCLGLLGLGLVGCSADVQKTPDSTRIEVEVPRVEVKKMPDLDVRTDDDVDIKVPGGRTP